jgi:ankyrin repeat protein
MATKEELYELLSDNTASTYARFVAIKQLYPETYSEFKLEYNIDNQNENGDTALIRASSRGHTEVVKFLIKEGADVNTKDIFGNTALTLASLGGYIEVVKLLLEAGADVNAKDKLGYTALTLARINGRTEIIKLLKQHGAKEE